eukprot:4698191-Prymnesium_polylepis.1
MPPVATLTCSRRSGKTSGAVPEKTMINSPADPAVATQSCHQPECSSLATANNSEIATVSNRRRAKAGWRLAHGAIKE